MKQYYRVFVVVCLMFVIQSLQAQDQRNFGLGIMVGEPTGLSAKLWTSPSTAFDFGLGWSMRGDRVDNGFNQGTRTHIHMDYLWHSFEAIHATDRFPLYYGLGGRLNSGGGYDATIAIRGVFGIAWMPRTTPIDLFLEVVPSFQLSASTGLAVDAAFGARYYF